MPEITTILSLALTITLIPVLSWYFARDKAKQDMYRVMDMAFLTLAMWFIISRVLGLIYFWDTLPREWSILPFTQPDSAVLYLQTWPWVIFRVTDGNFLFLEVVTAFFVIETIFRGLFEKRLGAKGLVWSQNIAVGVFCLAILPFLGSAYFNGYLADNTEIPFVVFLGLLSTITALLLVNISKDAVAVKVLLLIVQAASVAVFNLVHTGGQELLVINALMGVVILANAMYTISVVASLLRAQK